LAEFFEHNFLFFGANANAGIGDRDPYKVSVVKTIDIDAATLGRKFDRVAQQVVEDLFEA
jgi:hypothetical protein